MEFYAVYNWKVSPFNGDLNPDPSEDTVNHVFLQVLLDPSLLVTKTLNTISEANKYILCNFPFDAIQSIFPHDTIEVTTEIIKDGQRKSVKSTMIINKVIIRGNIEGTVVRTKKKNGISVFDKAFPITPTALTAIGIPQWLAKNVATGENIVLDDINRSVSRDPPSCKEYDI